MKSILAFAKYTIVFVFIGIMVVTIGAYLNLPLPLKPLIVKTGSMEPTIKTGSLVLVTEQGKSTSRINYINGDIITFKLNTELVSHRIVEIQKKDGFRYFVTKGDANNGVDQALVAERDVIGKLSMTVPFAGKFIDFVKTPFGFFLLILIPTLLLIISELFAVWEELRKKQSSSGGNLDFAKPLAMFFIAFIFVGSSHAFFSDIANVSGVTIQTAEAFCDEGPTWLSGVTENAQGTRKDTSAILPGRTDPNIVLGPTNWVSGGGTGFFSMGFVGGNATWAFPYQILNNSASLKFYEATNGRPSYPLETANVFVSQDGVTFSLLGVISSEPSGDGVTTLLLSAVPLTSIKYVKVVETSNPAIHTNDADGLDLDAVSAEFGNCE